MIARLWRYLTVGPDRPLGTVEWSWQRRQQAETVTARMLLGHAGPVRVLSDRASRAAFWAAVERDQR